MEGINQTSLEYFSDEDLYLYQVQVRKNLGHAAITDKQIEAEWRRRYPNG